MNNGRDSLTNKPPKILNGAIGQFGFLSLLDGCSTYKESTAKNSKYINSNLKYPSVARENGVQGTVKAIYKIDEYGIIRDVKVVKDPGAGCGEALASILNKLNYDLKFWIPAISECEFIKILMPASANFNLK